MKRGEWAFNYPVGRVLAGARNKLEFHKGRLDFWEVKRSEVEEALRTHGLVIDESAVGAGYVGTASNDVNGFGRQTRVSIDPALQRDLVETVEKVREHRGKVERYGAWIQVLSSQPETNTLELHQDDWIYFFGE